MYLTIGKRKQLRYIKPIMPEEDNLVSARGVIVGVVAGLCIWGAILTAVYVALR